ncbi:hypothetical protein HANVADRAFT_52628 [Hanseniaspora valbyensis NRRL Y-1626]|uniref:Uncharacterized protein n=1 Tax=Hanseniaspora valbyensis NRRL Y-1626 TaxID=766949 RepID=A0A1B7TED3_9ASCO|nr:hypothetical protein HANVADRAFT_52628 [Hanseniaspora valbyensis NRRL Y-1626]
MECTTFEKCLVNEKFTSTLNAFKRSIRSTDNSDKNNDEIKEINNKQLESVLSSNEILLDYIQDSSVDYINTSYKNIILEKIKDIHYLQIQSFLATGSRNEDVNYSKEKTERVGHIDKSDANMYVFKSQSKQLFLQNQQMIRNAYKQQPYNSNEQKNDTITFLVNINSLEAPNIKMMSKNFLNNLLQQIVFSDDENLYKTDVYKIYAPDDAVKCHQFMNNNQIDLDIGLYGLFFIGKLMKNILNITTLKKLRIICFYNDFKKFIPTVIEEFFVRLNEILLDIHNSDDVEEVVEFINVFDNESDNVSFNFHLVNESEEPNGEFMISNKMFMKFMETLNWNIAFDEKLLQKLIEQLLFDIDKGYWVSYLEDFFTEVLVYHFDGAIHSTNKIVIYSILAIDSECIYVESKNSSIEYVLTDTSFQKHLEMLATQNDLTSINECEYILQHKEILLEKIETDFAKKIPVVNSFFKYLVHEDYYSNNNNKINDVNFFELYCNVIQFIKTKDNRNIKRFIRDVYAYDNDELIDDFINKGLEFDLNTSDIFLNFKLIDDLNILQNVNPNYRYNMLQYDIEDEFKESKKKPYLFIAYKTMLELFHHIDISVKLGDLYYCFKENIKDKIPFDDDHSIMTLFIYTINQMTHSGFYEITNLHAVKNAFKGL